MTISKAKKSWIQSLRLKKKRDEEGCFVAEGIKLIEELSNHFNCLFLAYTDEYHTQAAALKANEHVETTWEDIKTCSLQKAPQGSIAVFAGQRPDINEFEEGDLTLILADIQDPGNLGTIIRTADWFGIRQIVCSETTTDCFNPKVVQSTMGALARVKVYSTPLLPFIEKHAHIPLLGTFMEGESIYSEAIPTHGSFIVMGNEGNGIPEEIAAKVSHQISIPSFSKNNNRVESLNVAIATAIICSEFRRREQK